MKQRGRTLHSADCVVEPRASSPLTASYASIAMASSAEASVLAATRLMPAVVSHVLDGCQAASRASEVFASAKRALRNDDEELSCARMRRAEALLVASTKSLASLARLVRDMQDMLVSDEFPSKLVLDSSIHSSWNSFSSSWWEEKRLGFRWRLGEVCDLVDEVNVTSASSFSCQHVDYAMYIASIRDRWRALDENITQCSSWTREWCELAALASSGVLGEGESQISLTGRPP